MTRRHLAGRRVYAGRHLGLRRYRRRRRGAHRSATREQRDRDERDQQRAKDAGRTRTRHAGLVGPVNFKTKRRIAGRSAERRITHRSFPMCLVFVRPIGHHRWMRDEDALAGLAALAHPTRLAAFRLLVRHEPAGLTTGQLVEATELTQSTFSTHLAVLARAGLVRAERRGRNFVQRADLDALRALMVFLAKDCCQGSPELCEPLLAELTCC